MDFFKLLECIELHHRDNPDHGITCACMDTYIQEFRRLSDKRSISACPDAQLRIDYIIRKAIDSR